MKILRIDWYISATYIGTGKCFNICYAHSILKINLQIISHFLTLEHARIWSLKKEAENVLK